MRQTISFEQFEIEPERRLLMKNGETVSLNPKAFDLLMVLVSNRGRIVSKNQLLDLVWENQFVEENNLTVQITALRKALGEQKNDHRFIITEPGRGYKFVADLTEEQDDEIIVESHKFERIVIEDKIQTSMFSGYGIKSLAAVMAVLAIAAGFFFAGRWFTTAGEKNVSFSPVTNSGRINTGSITADGQFAVFSQKEDTGQSLWLRHIKTGSQQRIIEPKPIDYLGITVSPDNNYIYCSTFQENKADPVVFRVKLFGGPEQELPFWTGAAVTFSPDGKQLAFVQPRSSLQETHLLIADADGANSRIVAKLPQSEKRFETYKGMPLAWSPNGNEIASALQISDENGVTGGISLFNISDGSERRFTDKRWAWVNHLAWAADGKLLVGGRDLEAVSSQIWSLDGENGNLKQLTNDLSDYDFLTVSRNLDNAIAVRRTIRSGLYVAAFDGATEKLEPRNILSESLPLSGAVIGPDDKIYYRSGLSGKNEIWSVNLDGSSPAQLTTDANAALGIAVSPNGQKIAFSSIKNGKYLLSSSDADGKNIRQIGDGVENIYPEFISDGRILFQKGVDNQPIRLWTTSLDGGKPEQLTFTSSSHPAVSPDGSKTAYYFIGENAAKKKVWQIAIISNATGAKLSVIDFPDFVSERNMIWHPNGKALLQGFEIGENAGVMMLPLDGSPSKTFTGLGKLDLDTLAISRDGKNLIFTGLTETRDAVSISGF